MLNWSRSSLRARLTTATAAVAALVCVAFGALFLILIGHDQAEQAKQRLSDTSDRVVANLKQRRLRPVLANGKDEAIQVVDAQGRVVASTRQLLRKPPMAGFLPPSGDLRAIRTLCPPAGLKGCMIVDSHRVYQPDGIWVIYTTVPAVPWNGNSPVLFMVIVGTVLLTGVAAVGTFRAIGKTLAPVNAIRRELAEITESDLDRRVPVPGNQHEIRSLAETANSTLDRLESAYERLRRFTSDASHDLRSPITAVRVQVEEGLMYPESTDWPQTASQVLAGMDRLQAIVCDLLTLDRLDARAPFVRTPVDLARLVETELDRHPRRVAIARDLHEGVVCCDRSRITRLLTNLLDNAERHAAGRIDTIVRLDESCAILEVVDDGAGIAPERREEVFERFTRLDTARHRGSGGTGLGLAIARQIVEAHGGTLTIEDSDRGARFVARLPLCRGAPSTRSRPWYGPARRAGHEQPAPPCPHVPVTVTRGPEAGR